MTDEEALNEPFVLFDSWFADAAASEPNDPNAMALATVDADGMPSVRMVLLKGHDAGADGRRGFVFYTNLDSGKGKHLTLTPKAALCFHWKSLRRQVRAEGPVVQVTDAEADAYFASRPRGSRIGAWASQQSRPLPDRETLERGVADMERRFPDERVPRPPHWSGFRLTPSRIEFWEDRPFRLHDRHEFQWSAEGWARQRLYP